MARLAKPTELAKLPEEPAELLDLLAELTRLTGLVGLVILNGLEYQTLLLVQRVSGLNLAHCNPCYGGYGRGGYCGGSPSPHLRPESLRRVVT
jgi:hypothetical protein